MFLTKFFFNRKENKNGQKILQLDITDDGIGVGLGLPADTVRAGARGLKNMHHRASEIGAQLTVSSRAAPFRGCRLLLDTPLQ